MDKDLGFGLVTPVEKSVGKQAQQIPDSHLGYYPGKYFRTSEEQAEIERRYGPKIGYGENSLVYAKDGVVTIIFTLTNDGEEVEERRHKIEYYQANSGKSPWITFFGTVPEGGFQQKQFSGVTIDKFLKDGGVLNEGATEEALRIFQQTVEATGQGHGDIVQPDDPRIPQQFRGRNKQIGYLVPNNILVDNTNPGQQGITILDWGNPPFLWQRGSIFTGSGLADTEFKKLEQDCLRNGLYSSMKAVPG